MVQSVQKWESKQTNKPQKTMGRAEGKKLAEVECEALLDLLDVVDYTI